MSLVLYMASSSPLRNPQPHSGLKLHPLARRPRWARAGLRGRYLAIIDGPWHLWEEHDTEEAADARMAFAEYLRACLANADDVNLYAIWVGDERRVIPNTLERVPEAFRQHLSLDADPGAPRAYRIISAYRSD